MNNNFWFLIGYFLSTLLSLFVYLLLQISTQDKRFLNYGISVGIPFYNFICNILLIFLLFFKAENRKYLNEKFNAIFVIDRKQKYFLSFAFIISFVIGLTVYFIHYYALDDTVWYTSFIFMFFFSISITLIILSFTIRIISLFKNKNFMKENYFFELSFSSTLIFCRKQWKE